MWARGGEEAGEEKGHLWEKKKRKKDEEQRKKIFLFFSQSLIFKVWGIVIMLGKRTALRGCNLAAQTGGNQHRLGVLYRLHIF